MPIEKKIGYRNKLNKQTLNKLNKQTLRQTLCIQQLFFLKGGELRWARKRVISLSKIIKSIFRIFMIASCYVDRAAGRSENPGVPIVIR